jgi:hypothetical protein
VRICHVGTKKWYTVNPEGVEGVDTLTSFCAGAKGARNTLVTPTTGTGVVV